MIDCSVNESKAQQDTLAADERKAQQDTLAVMLTNEDQHGGWPLMTNRR